MEYNDLTVLKTDGVIHHAKYTMAGQCFVYTDGGESNEVWCYSANIFSDKRPYEYIYCSGRCDKLNSLYIKEEGDSAVIPFIESKFSNKEYINHWGNECLKYMPWEYSFEKVDIMH